MEKSSNAFKIEQDPPLQNKFFSFKNKSLSSLLEKKKKGGSELTSHRDLSQVATSSLSCCWLEALPTPLHGGCFLQPPARSSFLLLLTFPRISWTCAGDLPPCGGELVFMESWWRAEGYGNWGLWSSDGCGEEGDAVCLTGSTACLL